MGQGPTFQRLRQIIERQSPARYGAEYIPSTLATREEAPSKSYPARIYWPKYNRYLHSLSRPETYAILLALYHPNIVEIHEQKMLSRWPCAHPLIGFNDQIDPCIPGILGTINVAERLGYGDLHPKIYIDDPDNYGGKACVAYPYQGDLLLFLKDESDRFYCINWTVKNLMESFYESSIDDNWTGSKEQKRKAYARYEIEQSYYEDAEIRTQKVALEKINEDLAANFSLIYPFACENNNLSYEKQRYVLKLYKECLESKIPPSDIISNLVYRNICKRDEAISEFYSAIWYRKLRIDLFKPILIDHPLNLERIDVLDFYQEWFKK